MSLVNRAFFPLAIGTLVGGLGCTPQDAAEPREHQEQSISDAVAVLIPTEGSEARGVVTFTQTEAGVNVVADLTGLEPGGHGFHIHEFGDCSASDGTSAGGHFNPEGTAHGAPSDSVRHIGDLGNVVADEAGNAHYEMTDDHLSFAGPHSIIGRAVIVHAGEDDLTTQPTGAAGPRAACGVIGIGRQ